MSNDCRGNPEGVAAALPTSPDRPKPERPLHPKAEVKPEPQNAGDESDVVMQDVKQEAKSPPPVKLQVHCIISCCFCGIRFAFFTSAGCALLLDVICLVSHAS